MKFIKLNSVHENEIIAIEVKNFNHIVMEQQSEKTIIDMGKLRSFSVKETIDEIIELLNGVDTWQVNKGLQPCDDNTLVRVRCKDGSEDFGEAFCWDWSLAEPNCITHYKIRGLNEGN